MTLASRPTTRSSRRRPTSAQGPTRVVDGYATDQIEGVYREMKDRLKEEQYEILFDELEEHDSEISYKSPDGATEGQIALRATCDNGNVSVHINCAAGRVTAA